MKKQTQYVMKDNQMSKLAYKELLKEQLKSQIPSHQDELLKLEPVEGDLLGIPSRPKTASERRQISDRTWKKLEEERITSKLLETEKSPFVCFVIS